MKLAASNPECEQTLDEGRSIEKKKRVGLRRLQKDIQKERERKREREMMRTMVKSDEEEMKTAMGRGGARAVRLGGLRKD